MPALRVDISAGVVLDSTVSQQLRTITLDCWKAELWIVTNTSVLATPFYINGVPLSGAFFPSTATGEQLPGVMKFGGFMQKGLPVNLNEELVITPSVAGGAQLSYLLTRTYYDPHLDDPQKQP